MKHSTLLRIALPTAFVVGALMGCTHSRSDTSVTPRSRSTITAADLERAPDVPIEQLLAARVPGLMITRAPDGRTIMRLRGTSSLGNDGEPLFVVNGLALGSSSSLAAISRSEIASIEVLKDPASTAAWGIRGTNGVIVIKTKS